MSNTLQEAIAAVRAGDMENAQIIAAGIVRDNPDDPNGWYLLSQLVDSDARRAAYLGKTLALDPDHPRARVEFAALPPALTADLAPAAVTTSYEREWLDKTAAVSELPPVTEADIQAAAQRVEAAAAGAAAWDTPTATDLIIDERPEDLPEWLQPLAPEPVAATVEPAAAPLPASSQKPRPAAVKKSAPAKKKNGDQALMILFGLLGLLTVVVLVFLFYLLFF